MRITWQERRGETERERQDQRIARVGDVAAAAVVVMEMLGVLGVLVDTDRKGVGREAMKRERGGGGGGEGAGAARRASRIGR